MVCVQEKERREVLDAALQEAIASDSPAKSETVQNVLQLIQKSEDAKRYSLPCLDFKS